MLSSVLRPLNETIPTAAEMKENPVKALTAIRLSASNNSELTEATKSEIKDHFTLITVADKESEIKTELDKILQLNSIQAKSAFQIMLDMNLLAIIYPQFCSSLTEEQRKDMIGIVSYVTSVKEESAFESFYNQLLAITKFAAPNELQYDEKASDSSKLLAGYKYCNNDPSALNEWLKKDVFGFGNAVKNFSLLIESGSILTDIFGESITNSLFENRKWLESKLQLVDDRDNSWRKNNYNYTHHDEYGGYADDENITPFTFRPSYIDYIYANIIAAFKINSRGYLCAIDDCRVLNANFSEIHNYDTPLHVKLRRSKYSNLLEHTLSEASREIPKTANKITGDQFRKFHHTQRRDSDEFDDRDELSNRFNSF